AHAFLARGIQPRELTRRLEAGEAFVPSLEAAPHFRQRLPSLSPTGYPRRGVASETREPDARLGCARHAQDCWVVTGATGCEESVSDDDPKESVESDPSEDDERSEDDEPLASEESEPA